MKKKVKDQKLQRNKVRRVFFLIVLLINMLGLGLVAFANGPLATTNRAAPASHHVGRINDNDSQINSRQLADGNLGATNLAAPAPDATLFPGPNTTLYTIAAPAGNIGDDVAITMLANIRGIDNGALYDDNPVLQTWAEDMVIQPIVNPATSPRAGFFTPQVLKPVLDAINKTNVILTNSDQIELTGPPTNIVNILDTTNHPNPANFWTQVMTFTTTDPGIATLGYSVVSTATQTHYRLVMDNTAQVLNTETIAEAITNGDIFVRQEGGASPVSPNFDNEHISIVKTNNQISVFVRSTGTEAVDVWQPSLPGNAAQPISSVSFGVLGIDLPGVMPLPTGFDTPVNLPIYSETLTPPVANPKTFTFYLKRDASLVMALKTNQDPIIPDFDFNFDGTTVTYNTGGTGTTNPNINIPDTSYDDALAYDLNVSWAASTAPAGQFARVTVSYDPNVFELTDNNSQIDLNNGTTSFYYQSIFFEAPNGANFGTNTDETLTGRETIDPDRLAKLGLARVMEQWAGIRSDLTLSNSLTLTYQGVTGSATQPENTNWDDTEIDRPGLTGQQVYQILTSQSGLEYNILTTLGISPTIHGAEDSEDYYTLTINDDSLVYLQTKMLAFVGDFVTQQPLSVVLSLVQGLNDVDDIPADTYAQIEQQLLVIVQGVLRESFKEFKLRLYSRVYNSYADTLVNPGQNAPQIFSADPLRVVSGDVAQGTALLATNNTALVTGPNENFNTQIAQSIVGFINQYNLAGTLFPDPQTRFVWNNISQSADFWAPQVFRDDQQKDKADDVFAIWNSLFTWLKIPVGEILKLALDPAVSGSQLPDLLRNAMQSVVQRLVSSDLAMSTDYQGTEYRSSYLNTLVTNNNIRTTLDSIDLTGRSDAYKANLSLAKASDFRSLLLTRQFASATENFDIGQYAVNFANGSRTTFYANQIRNLDFANPNLFAIPEPTSFIRSLMNVTDIVVMVVTITVSAGLLYLSFTMYRRYQVIAKSAVANNATSRKLVLTFVITITVLAVVATIFIALIATGAITFVTPFAPG